MKHHLVQQETGVGETSNNIGSIYMNTYKGGSSVKYAVPMSGGTVSAHFGHCEQFALIDVDEVNKKILNKKIVNSPGHEPGLLPKWLAQQGVNLIITGGMGTRAQNLFQQNRIGVIVGVVESDPDKAVIDYLNGTLTKGNNICDH